LGWGAYTIEKWEPGQYIRLHKNPFYFRAGEGLPKFDTLIFRFVGKDPKTNLEAIASGECDVLDQEASLALLGEEMETALAMDQEGKLRAYIVPSLVWESADFGIRPLAYDDGYQPGVDRPDFFGDVRVRRAIALCMDRQQIIEKVLHGLSSVPDSYIPQEHPLHNPNVARYPFDVAAGSALLQEVGWVDHDGNPNTPRIAQGVANVPDGTPFEFTYVTTTAQQRQQAAQILANSLAQCGIQVNLDFIKPDELFAEGPQGYLFGRHFEMAQLAWMTNLTPPCNLFLSEQIPGDPNLLDENNQPIFPYGWSGTNITGYSNPEYDRACRSALATLPGQPNYLENHFKAQEIFADELPVIPLYVRLKAAATRHDLCGFAMDASTYSELWNIEAFDYGEGCP
jgi:peptide/nickel transport system substrate-binding protein